MVVGSERSDLVRENVSAGLRDDFEVVVSVERGRDLGLGNKDEAGVVAAGVPVED